jgi:hypothetical protein
MIGGPGCPASGGIKPQADPLDRRRGVDTNGNRTSIGLTGTARGKPLRGYAETYDLTLIRMTGEVYDSKNLEQL